MCVSVQVGYPGRQNSPTSPADRTAEWLGRYVGNGDARSSSPGHDSANSSKRNSTASSNGSSSVLVGPLVTWLLLSGNLIIYIKTLIFTKERVHFRVIFLYLCKYNCDPIMNVYITIQGFGFGGTF